MCSDYLVPCAGPKRPSKSPAPQTTLKEVHGRSVATRTAGRSCLTLSTPSELPSAARAARGWFLEENDPPAQPCPFKRVLLHAGKPFPSVKFQALNLLNILAETHVLSVFNELILKLSYLPPKYFIGISLPLFSLGRPPMLWRRVTKQHGLACGHAFVPLFLPDLSGALAFTVKILRRPTPERP